MSEKCCGCNQKLKKWNHKIFKDNNAWHQACWDAWHEGYKIAFDHCTTMNKRFALPTPDEIYWATTTGFVSGTKQQMDLLKKISEQLKTPIVTAQQKRRDMIPPQTGFHRKD